MFSSIHTTLTGIDEYIKSTTTNNSIPNNNEVVEILREIQQSLKPRVPAEESTQLLELKNMLVGIKSSVDNDVEPMEVGEISTVAVNPFRVDKRRLGSSPTVIEVEVTPNKRLKQVQDFRPPPYGSRNRQKPFARSSPHSNAPPTVHLTSNGSSVVAAGGTSVVSRLHPSVSVEKLWEHIITKMQLPPEASDVEIRSLDPRDRSLDELSLFRTNR